MSEEANHAGMGCWFSSGSRASRPGSSRSFPKPTTGRSRIVIRFWRKSSRGRRFATKTLDSGGQDENGVHRIEPFNPLNGPFLCRRGRAGRCSRGQDHEAEHEHRNWGWSAYRLGLFSLTPEAVEHVYPNEFKPDLVRPGRSSLVVWDLDLTKKTVKLREPVSQVGEHGVSRQAHARLHRRGSGGRFLPQRLVLREVMAVIWIITRSAEGATVYLPVSHPGGLLFLGDGHALQADGEPTGTGIETTMDVEFQVELLKAAKLTGPRVETADEIISLGSQPEFASALDNGLKMATTDMVEWLTHDYAMEPWAAHLWIGYQGKYDVVTVAGTMALRISKDRLPRKKVVARKQLPSNKTGIVTTEFLPCPETVKSSHASTIAETPAGLVAAWFGGEREGSADVGIWVSRQVDDEWTPAVQVADGVQALFEAIPDLEPRALPSSPGSALALLQGRSQPQAMVGDDGGQPRLRTNLVAASPSSRRHSWTHQK